MKMRLIKITPQFLIERLQSKHTDSPTNLPSDLELINIEYDLLSGQVLVVVRSDSFEDISEACPIPEFKLTNVELSQTALHSQPDIKPIPKIKPKEAEPPKIASISTNYAWPLQKKDTGLMEEEFTDEQRRLLSFSVDEGFVIVKPVKFLKAEWDDINDTVRSLGGRWVKGDIISYWEIPIHQE